MSIGDDCTGRTKPPHAITQGMGFIGRGEVWHGACYPFFVERVTMIRRWRGMDCTIQELNEIMASETRIEKDSMGEMTVPGSAY